MGDGLSGVMSLAVDDCNCHLALNLHGRVLCM